jgi:hypothetical protein
MQADLAREFSKLTAHFGTDLDADRLAHVAALVSKRELHRLVGPERPEVVDLTTSYAETREGFADRFGRKVWGRVLAGREHLSRYFSHTEIAT